MRCFAVVFLSLFLVQNARASKVSDAQAFVTEQLKKGVNILDAATCEKLEDKGGKRICELKKDGAKMSVLLISSSSPDKKISEKIGIEFSSLTRLHQASFPVAEIGSEFINQMPCSDAKDAKRECGGFVEEKLGGAEIQWSQYDADIMSGRVSSCSRDNAGFQRKIEGLYGKGGVVKVGGKDTSLQQYVADNGNKGGFRGQLAGDVAKVGAHTLESKLAVIDLQMFVADSGDAKIFDVEGTTTVEKNVKCWGEALLVFSRLIEPPRE